MTAQSVFALGACHVYVQGLTYDSATDVSGGYDVGDAVMNLGDSQTYTDPGLINRTLTVAVSDSGVVTLDSSDAQISDTATCAGYQINVIPVQPLTNGSQVWIQDFIFGSWTNEGASILPFVDVAQDDNFTQEWNARANADGTFTPDPTPATTLSDAPGIANYYVRSSFSSMTPA